MLDMRRQYYLDKGHYPNDHNIVLQIGMGPGRDRKMRSCSFQLLSLDPPVVLRFDGNR